MVNQCKSSFFTTICHGPFAVFFQPPFANLRFEKTALRLCIVDQMYDICLGSFGERNQESKLASIFEFRDILKSPKFREISSKLYKVGPKSPDIMI